MIDVSVIVPVYNKGPYLPELIDSLRRQTCASFDVWLIDDGSTDGSGRICDVAADVDHRFHVIHMENSGWPGRPRNVGIDASESRYLFFADADDWCEPGMLADLVGFADAHHSDVVIPSVLSEGHAYTTKAPVLENVVDMDMRDAFLTLTPHKLFRRSYFDALGLRFTEQRVPLEDGQLVARAYVGGGRISRCGERLGYHYMGRDGTNISYEPRDPIEHGRSITIICESARQVGEHADEIILDMYRRKLLRYMAPQYLLKMPPERAAGYVQATADFAERFISTELEATLTPWPRLASRTARLRQPELCTALAGAKADDAVPAVRRDGHWFIGPVPADDIVSVRVKARKSPAAGVRIVLRPEWAQVATPRLHLITEDNRLIDADDTLTPAEPLPGPCMVTANWDDLGVVVGYSGEPVSARGLRFYSTDDQLTVAPG